MEFRPKIRRNAIEKQFGCVENSKACCTVSVCVFFRGVGGAFLFWNFQRLALVFVFLLQYIFFRTVCSKCCVRCLRIAD